jgi:hypothetical protein
MKSKESYDSPADETCEIIETAIAEIDLLTRTFTLIQEICEESNTSVAPFLYEPPERLVN